VVHALPTERLVALLDEHAPMRAVPLCPELAVWTADDELPLWQALEEELGETIGAPFFCMPWPGAQALALLVERGPERVAGRRVLDVGCGSGLAALACARAGAEVVAVDVDPLAVAATRALAERAGVPVRGVVADVLAEPTLLGDFDVVLAGDLVYSRELGERLRRAVPSWRERGAHVVLADSGRPFFDDCGLPRILEVEVPVPPSVDGVDRRRVCVYAQEDAKEQG
jgi:predicted nicotinamide N-methyase